MIAILDYDTSDADEVARAFEAAGARTEIVKSIDRLDRASKIVLPPAASFARAVRFIRDRDLVTPLMRAIDHGRPFLGIAQGMHLFFDVSYEEGRHTGLGVIPGKVTNFNFGAHPVARSTPPVHEGWNQVHIRDASLLLGGIASGTPFFFRHSHFAEPLDRAAIAAVAHHGFEFSAMVRQQSVIGIEFLPHASDEAGRRVLRNFSAM